MNTYQRLIGLFLALSLFATCAKKEEQTETAEKLFSMLNASETGIDFKNVLTENDSLNYFTYSYLYMGGGVSAGDVNNDGLIDLYFTGNQVSNKLYLNKGNMKFEDVTEKAGVGGDSRWYTGVTMADVNGDGFLDIYCSVGGKYAPKNNQLFINNQDGTFTESAKKYGLDDTGNSVQATFFDYDNDGDLDVYVANYPPTKFSSPTFVYVQKMRHVTDEETNHLYRNDGEIFTDVTEEAGLKSFGLSLSATVGDLNGDGWSDIYVSNDFNSPDELFLNQKDGRFKNEINTATGHTAFYGMGADISDFNNDGHLDIFQVDMDAENNRRQKANMASMNRQLFKDIENAGFQFQYMQNCMQLNSGINEDGIPQFSNISRLTGTSSTDWSWGPLFADFDNDGFKDLYITNGTRREINNNDYFNKLDDIQIPQDTLLKLSLNIPSEKIDNFMFKNKGGLEFERSNTEWGIEYKGFSNGVVYADLDNDGDLEIVINNIDDFATVFKNNNSEGNNFITLNLKGPKGNTSGLGARVFVTTEGQTQMQELTLTRGFQSSVAPQLHFGLGKNNQIDELKVVWSDGKQQLLKNVKPNQILTLNNIDSELKNNVEDKKEPRLFETVQSEIFPPFSHTENNFDDFVKQILLPHKMSTFGPTVAVGDMNNDGLEDYIIGGAAGYPATAFFQTQNGFKQQNLNVFETDKASEDMGILIFDADADGDNDLYIVSGGYEFTTTSEALQDRLYINNGKGNFTKAETSVIPKMLTSGSRAYNADFDKDGKQDILVLGRQIPGQYPNPASSYLLHNVSTNGEARFELFSKEYSALFQDLGMATSAVITDFNNDSYPDIIVVGEWMPILVFKNTRTGFVEVSDEMGLGKDTTGWWWSIQQGDFDNDGDMDYVLGNNGLNYKYKANQKETFDIYVNDFDKNNQQDIVLGYYSEGKQYPVRGRGCSSEQIPSIKNKFKNYETFSEATLVDVYSEDALKSALHYQVKSFGSIYLENKNGKFEVHKLPIEAQVSSINQILIDDFDNDKHLDILIAGNLYNSEVETPRNDAGHGLFLKGSGKGTFTSVDASKSGFYAKGDVKDMSIIHFQGMDYLIVAKNNGALQFVELK